MLLDTQDRAGGRRRLLLIEDNRDDSELLHAMLRATQLDYVVTVADSLAAATKCDSGERWSMILVDVGLPDCQGVDTFHQCQQRWMDSPIVVLSGLSDEMIAQEAVRAGAQDYLVKGDFNARALARALTYATERHDSAQERREIMRELEKSRRFESIGQLAAGVAHEINTPTQYITDNTRFIGESVATMVSALTRLRSCAGDGESLTRSDLDAFATDADLAFLSEELPRAVAQSLDGLDHIARIVRAMRQISHPGNDVRASVDVHKYIDMAVFMSIGEWKHIARIEKCYDSSIPPIECHPGPLSQVFLNLIVNAAHAIAEVKGSAPTERGRIKVSTRRLEDDWISVSVEDTGAGVPVDCRGSLFEPYFTTKGLGKGTGQGLSIAREVVERRHGGAITFETEVGRGTTFVVRLPLARKGVNESASDMIAA